MQIITCQMLFLCIPYVFPLHPRCFSYRSPCFPYVVSGLDSYCLPMGCRRVRRCFRGGKVHRVRQGRNAQVKVKLSQPFQGKQTMHIVPRGGAPWRLASAPTHRPSELPKSGSSGTPHRPTVPPPHDYVYPCISAGSRCRVRSPLKKSRESWKTVENVTFLMSPLGSLKPFENQ